MRLVIAVAGGVALLASAAPEADDAASIARLEQVLAKIVAGSGVHRQVLSDVRVRLNPEVAVAETVHVTPPRIEVNPKFLALLPARDSDSVLALVIGHELGHIVLGADSDELAAERLGVIIASAAGLSINVAFSSEKNPVALVYHSEHEKYVGALTVLVDCAKGHVDADTCFEAGLKATISCVFLEELTLRESQLYQLARKRHSLGGRFYRTRDFSCASQLGRVRNTVVAKEGNRRFDDDPRVARALVRLDQLEALSLGLMDEVDDGHELRPAPENWLHGIAQTFSAAFQVVQRADGGWAVGWEVAPLAALARLPELPIQVVMSSRLAYRESYGQGITLSRGLLLQYAVYPVLVPVAECDAGLCGILLMGTSVGASYDWHLDRDGVRAHGAALVGGLGAELDFGLEQTDQVTRARMHLGLGLWGQYPLLGLRETGWSLGLQLRLAL